MNLYPKEVLSYIESHIREDIHHLLLKKSPFEDYSMREIVAQIKGRQIAKKKFPFLLEFPQFKYPIKLSLEQASSEATARYKASLMAGEKLIDLTGGMGIDTYFIGNNFKEITYVDVDQDLCALAKWNFEVLGLKNFTILNQSADKITGNFNTIYIDPSRRVNGNRKYDIRDLVPNVIDLQDQLIKMSNQIVIKLSPMQDIKSAKTYLRNIDHIHYISLDGELKEVLIIIDKKAKDIKETIAILGKKDTIFTLSDASNNITFSETKSYLYLPDAAVMKSGKQDIIAAQFGLQKLHRNTHIYTSETMVDFPGRIFQVLLSTQLNKKSVLPHLKSKKANVISKNHPLTPDQIKKKIGIKDGGEDYIIAFTDVNDKKAVAICRKVLSTELFQ